ncbi:MAG: thiol-activated cytolysin family protein [Acidimicrobiia bacterium]|nr:thiol-activated cytolysin family protein [Acidimicrobiia bacterium]
MVALVVVALFFGPTPVASSAPDPGEATSLAPLGQFTDDEGNVHESDIERLFAAGITKGCNPPFNDEFCPDQSVTRGQMAAFLRRALELKTGASDHFIDDGGSVFESDINAVALAGVARGCNPPVNDRFCPDDPVTRGQMAAFLVRAFGYTTDGGGNLFTDDDGSVFEADIDRLGAEGVTKGCNPPMNDQFCPEASVTRGQMASFLTRALHLDPVTAYEVDKEITGWGSWDEYAQTKEPAEPAPIPGKATTEFDEILEGVTYDCETTPYTMTDTPRELVVFEPDVNILWPGALIQGSSHKSARGSLMELPIRQRDPVALSINLLTEDTTRTVENPTVATVQQAIGELVAAAENRGLDPSGSVFFEQERSYSATQAALRMGLSAKYMSARVRAALEMSRAANENTVTAYFLEKAFTVSIVLPETPSAVFSDDFTPERLREQVALGRLGPDNLPVYVADVTYGRILMVSMTSTQSVDRIMGALAAAYNGGVFKVSGSLAAGYQEILADSRMQVVTIGGSSQNARDLIRQGDIGAYFDQSADLSDYRPLSYTLRNLGDNSIARMSETTEYEVTECTAVPAPSDQKIGERIEILVDSFDIQQDCNAHGSGTYDIDITVNDETAYEIDDTGFNSGNTVELAISRTVDLIANDTAQLVAFVTHIKDGKYDTARFTADIGTSELREVIVLAKYAAGEFTDSRVPVDRTLPGYREGEMRVLDTGPFSFVEETCRWVLRYRVSKVGDIAGDGSENIRPIVGITAPVATLAIDDTVLLTGNVVDDGLPEGGGLDYEWTIVSKPEGAAPTLTSSDQPATTASGFTELGDYTFRLSVSDAEPLTGHDDIVISVVANEAPEVDAGTYGPIPFVGDPTVATLTGSVDDDGLPRRFALSTEWTLVAGPQGSTAIIGDPEALTTEVSFDVPGVYVLQLNADDGMDSTSDLVALTVGSAAPDVTVSLVSAPPVVAGVAADLEAMVRTDGVMWGAPVTWSMVSGPGVVEFDRVGPETSATFDTAGTYVVRASATDGFRIGTGELIVEVGT